MTIQKLHFRSNSVTGLSHRTVARVTFEHVSPDKRADYFFALSRKSDYELADLTGYAAVLVEQGAEDTLPEGLSTPVVTGYKDLGRMFCQDYIASISERNGDTRIVYRPESPHNTIFATGRCNSNCLMCSQPPTLADDNSIVEEHLRIIDLVKTPPEMFGITGGEPTLLGDGLVRILERM